MGAMVFQLLVEGLGTWFAEIFGPGPIATGRQRLLAGCLVGSFTLAVPLLLLGVVVVLGNLLRG